MNRFPAVCACLLAGMLAAPRAPAWLDQVDDALAWTAAHDTLRARVSGTFDLEGYYFSQPPPGLVYADGHALLNPRLTLFLDAQVGARLYVFSQARLDRGFDPADGPARGRLDEWAIRFTPRADGVFNLQIGKFSTVVGNWVKRHDSWDNPFVTAPLPYENLTGIFDSAAARSAGALLAWANLGPPAGGANAYLAGERVPILWGPSYASGAAVSGAIGRWDYAVEVKNASLSSRPASWDVGPDQWRYPTFSGRVGFRPDESWNLGLSASTGTYLTPAARPTLAPGRNLGDYREIVWGQDIGYAWHHVQVWAEAYAASFEIPLVGRADTLAYYVEGKFRITPRVSGAVRWNQQVYGDIPDRVRGPVPWGRDVWRIDLAPAFRFSPHTELKLQYSLQSGGLAPSRYSRELAGQLVVRF